MDWWLMGIITFLVLMFIGAIWTRFGCTKFDKGFRESNGIFDDGSGKELFFEHVETVKRSDRNRTPVTHVKTRTDILDNMAVAGYFPPPVSKSSSSFFNSDASNVSCHSSNIDGSCGGGD